MTTGLFIWDTRAPNHPAARDTLVVHVYVNNKAGVAESILPSIWPWRIQELS